MFLKNNFNVTYMKLGEKINRSAVETNKKISLARSFVSHVYQLLGTFLQTSEKL